MVLIIYVQVYFNIVKVLKEEAMYVLCNNIGSSYNQSPSKGRGYIICNNICYALFFLDTSAVVVGDIVVVVVVGLKELAMPAPDLAMPPPTFPFIL